MLAEEKARSIGLVIIKISVYARRPEFRRRLESIALDLIEQVSAGDFTDFLRIEAVIRNLIVFGRNIYEIEPINADYIIKELQDLNVQMRQINEHVFTEMLNNKLGFIDTAMPDNPESNAAIASIKKSSKDNTAKRKAGKPNNPAIESGKIESGNDISGLNMTKTDDNPATRYTAIVDKIRKFGNEPAKFKDILGEFPGISDRTLRYDLQRLCSDGIIERVGPGGPATYYRIRSISI